MMLKKKLNKNRLNKSLKIHLVNLILVLNLFKWKDNKIMILIWANKITKLQDKLYKQIINNNNNNKIITSHYHLQRNIK